jgi:hypothetical protein
MSVNDASGVITDDSRFTLNMVASLTYNSKGVIHDSCMFIVHAISLLWKMLVTLIPSLSYLRGGKTQHLRKIVDTSV